MRYYFIKDWVETGDVVIVHCPSEDILGDQFTNPLQGALFRNFRAENINIPDDLDMGEMGMDRIGLKKVSMWKLHNETDPRCLQECVGGCGKVGRGNGAKYCPNGGTHNVTHNAVILEKGEMSRVDRSYADITREDVKTSLEENRLIIS